MHEEIDLFLKKCVIYFYIYINILLYSTIYS